ncbi:MAG: KamA family radical SAM protein [Deltaproteobacteria bacterium]|nr:KamA family radical SAM protein [Deltaproteobacteria bacterium]
MYEVSGRKSGWRRILSASLVSPQDIADRLGIGSSMIEPVTARYPARINPYYLSLIESKGDSLWRQAVPDPAELKDRVFKESDPLSEAGQSPVAGLIHRYPDRVLFMVSDKCAMYCRYCMRKRIVGGGKGAGDVDIGKGLDYISRTPRVREVILSGGDPLMADDAGLDKLLSRISRIEHVEVIRIHTRMPCTLPFRITSDLVRILGAHAPLYVNIQFNHPDELTDEAKKACAMLADAGIPLGCQTVLLAGVNDDIKTMTALMTGLLAARIRPYYIHHPDPVQGTAHFTVPLKKGLEIMDALRGNISGMGVPNYMIDLPGGGGKVPLLPQYVLERTEEKLVVRNFENQIFEYQI